MFASVLLLRAFPAPPSFVLFLFARRIGVGALQTGDRRRILGRGLLPTGGRPKAVFGCWGDFCIAASSCGAAIQLAPATQIARSCGIHSAVRRSHGLRRSHGRRRPTPIPLSAAIPWAAISNVRRRSHGRRRSRVPLPGEPVDGFGRRSVGCWLLSVSAPAACERRAQRGPSGSMGRTKRGTPLFSPRTQGGGAGRGACPPVPGARRSSTAGRVHDQYR